MTKPKTLEQLRAEKERAETQLAQDKQRHQKQNPMTIKHRKFPKLYFEWMVLPLR